MNVGAHATALLSLAPPARPHFKDHPKVNDRPAGGLRATSGGPMGALHPHKHFRGFNYRSSSHHQTVVQVHLECGSESAGTYKTYLVTSFWTLKMPAQCNLRQDFRLVHHFTDEPS